MSGLHRRTPTGWRSLPIQALLCEPIVNGRSVNTREDGFPVLRLTAIKPNAIDLNEHKTGDWNEEQAKPFLVTEGDFLISRGNGSIELVGRGAPVLQSSPRVAFPDTMIRVRVNPDEILTAYLSRAWESPVVRNQIKQAARTTSGIYKINQRVVEEIRLPVPPLRDQRRIADVLNFADGLRARRRKTIVLLDELAQSVFVDLFGNIASNDRKWDASRRLSEVADIASGITKGRRIPPSPLRSIPYLAVSNVQERRLDLSAVKTIDATESEIERYRLVEDDLLLTEGGDPDKLGRGTLWRDEIDECIHQNHIFRVRLRAESKIEPVFLNWLISSERGRRYFLKSAKQTTGIASINASQLKQFPLLVPPIALQQKFARRINELERHKVSHLLHLAELDALFASLQHRAFRGELLSASDDLMSDSHL